MKYLVTSCLNAKEKRKIEEKGLYCYDLRYSDFGEDIACIEKSVLVNRVGSMITNEKIPLEDKYPNNYVDYETFIANNERIETLDELLSLNVMKYYKKIEARNNRMEGDR